MPDGKYVISGVTMRILGLAGLGVTGIRKNEKGFK
jgi:hypothetical protein